MQSRKEEEWVEMLPKGSIIQAYNLQRRKKDASGPSVQRFGLPTRLTLGRFLIAPSPIFIPASMP